jgi:biopolymer transport protein ExbB/TolQ
MMGGFWELFLKGGPIMWPILLLSIITGGAVLERFWFLLTAGRRSKTDALEQLFSAVEGGDLDTAAREGQRSRDRLARILSYGSDRAGTLAITGFIPLVEEKAAVANAVFSFLRLAPPRLTSQRRHQTSS